MLATRTLGTGLDRLTAYQAFRTTSYRHRTERRPALQASLEPLDLAFDEQRLVAISAPH
jgi:hypothetical protein